MASDQASSLAPLPERLVREAADGRRQRLFGMLVAALRSELEQLAMTAPPACQVTGYLGFLAAVVRATGHIGLAKALAEPLSRTLNPPEDLAHYLRTEVAWTICETHRYRAEVAVPATLPAAGEPPVGPRLRAAFEALRVLPADLLDAILLSSCARPRTVSELVVLRPPATGLTVASAGAQSRPPAGGWPTALAAAIPADAAVVDARAERLWLDETVAEVAARQPRVIAVQQPESPGPDFDVLIDQLRATLPLAALWLLVPDESTGDSEHFQRRLAGPPFPALAALRDVADAPAIRPPSSPAPDLAAWPLACYRRTATDADVILPLEDRSGAELARALAAAHEQCPTARLRLAAGLTSAQAAELAVAARRPDPPAWTMPLVGAALPADPLTLRRAGLSGVVVTVGKHHLPPPLLSVVAEALVATGLQLLVAVETAGLAPNAVLSEVRAARPAAVSFHGPEAPAFEVAWAEAQS